MEIVISKEYLLDGVHAVKVVKALNRANTVFCVALGSSLLTVERGRLSSIEKVEENMGGDNLDLEEATVNSLSNALKNATDDHYDYE